MKKNIRRIVILIGIFIISGTVYGDGISILKLTSDSIPFNEMRDPVNDSLYNIFDTDPVSSALFSDFTVQFNMPVTVDEFKIINGNSSQFKKFGRLKDIEITLYTTSVKDDKKSNKPPLKKTNNKKTEKSIKIRNEQSNDEKENLPVEENKQNKKPEKDKEDKKNDSDKKNSGGLTAFYKTDILLPVIGELKNPLAEEPGNSVMKETGIKELDKPQKEKTDIRDSAKSASEGKKEAGKKTFTEKKKKAEGGNTNKVTDKKGITNHHDKLKKETPAQNDELPFKKMEGKTKIENDSEGRVLVNVSLKDIPEEQSIKLGGIYIITAMEIRKRDDFNYPGSDSELLYFSGLGFYNKGKRLTFQGIEPLKKVYETRFVKALDLSLAGVVFSSFNNDKEVTRVFFRKNGNIDIRDRYKCFRANDPDCTSALMPDKWSIHSGKLLMRFKNEWIPWKYELEYTPEFMNGAEREADSRQWLKLYFKNESGFSENYLYLEKSVNQDWGWN